MLELYVWRREAYGGQTRTKLGIRFENEDSKNIKKCNHKTMTPVIARHLVDMERTIV